ncbi:MAG: type II toxin-antitoxin system VapC family toxin [Nitrososphaera sp.]|uniref:type II toxin-antitoxin system VapC family toxin n=1 Tax=Nitrososphaera sp. TaxID=1971748 RepID=UPI0017A25F73|nr:type II toxin-antitoxin system VapC family toxin [Nitrososphaera sp.]NWG36295.1 type II toxin-antitoxin system VapC family toxin [Nitrososphaera sp.]
MVCVDTDFLIDLGRKNQKALEKLQEFEANGENVLTTAITVAELYHGANRAKNKTRALANVKDDLARFQILDLNYDSAMLWGELSERLKSNSIGELDLFIASIALANKQTLITRNAKHFERVPGLTVDGW